MLVNRKRLERIYADFGVAPKFFLCYPFIMFTEELVLMFVDVKELKNPIAIENILTPYKKGRLSSDKKTRLPKEPITPQVCMEILKSTNYSRNIKDMLLCIKELPQAEQAQFKEVVLATFTQREQPSDVLVEGKKLAHASGYDDELSAVLEKGEGKFLFSDAKVLYGYRNKYLDLSDEEIQNIESFECSGSEFQALNRKELPRQMSFPVAERLYFFECDFQNVQALSFHPNAVVFMNSMLHLPERMDVSTCKRLVVKYPMLPEVENWTVADGGLGVDYRKFNMLSGELDFSDFGYVDLSECNLADVTKIRWRKGACVLMRGAKNLPSDIDFSNCAKVDLSECDLAEQTLLSFADGAEVILCGAMNLPPDIDFSNCAKVDLSECNLRGQTKLCFDKAEWVSIEQSAFWQKNLNFPKCKYLSLMGSNLLPQTKLYFPMAREVNLASVTNLPKDIDVSHCAKVSLGGCDLKNQPNLRFADGAEVTLHSMDYLPPNLDFSRCAKLHLNGVNFRNCAHLRFAEGAQVFFNDVSGLPKVLDVSSCGLVHITNSDFSYIDAVIFKNEQQGEKCDFGFRINESLKIFFADKMTEEDWNEVKALKQKQKKSLKQAWRNKIIRWGGRR